MQRTFSWSGHGNLGDDWLADVALQQLEDAYTVREERCLRPACLGRHCLTGSHGEDAPSLVLWGGGWLAADREGSTTLRRWARHVRREAGDVFAFGLGIGPFNRLRHGDTAALSRVFARVQPPFVVRTPADLGYLPDAVTAEVGCDVALLDERFDDALREPTTTQARSTSVRPFVVASFPRYSDHWLQDRPWMTQDWYRRFVTDRVRGCADGLTTLFLEFDSASGVDSDAEYWRGLTDSVARPRSILEARDILVGAEAMVAGRLHAALLGALTGVPTMALAYHHKFEVIADLGIPTFGLHGADGPISPGLVDPATLAKVRQRGRRQLATLKAGLTLGRAS